MPFTGQSERHYRQNGVSACGKNALVQLIGPGPARNDPIGKIRQHGGTALTAAIKVSSKY